MQISCVLCTQSSSTISGRVVDGASCSTARRNLLGARSLPSLTELSLPRAWCIIFLLKSVFEVTTELHHPCQSCIALDPRLSFASGREIWRLTVICKREFLWREVSWRCEGEMKRSHPKELPTRRCCCRLVPSQETQRALPWLLHQCRCSGMDGVCSAPAAAVVLALKLVLANWVWC